MASESALSMTREKRVSPLVGLAYRGIRTGKRIIGRERLLRLTLDGSRWFSRFAFELSGEIYGGRFHNHAKALSEELLREVIPSGGSVIDIGCGNGRWCEVAAKYASRVVGIDYSEELIESARDKSEHENVEYMVGDVTTDLHGQEFNVALLLHVIEHVDDSDKLLSELKSVANKLIVEVPDFAQDSLNLVRLEQGLSFYSDADHVREYTQEILDDQLQRNGWKIVSHRKNGGAVLAVAENEGKK